MVPYPLLFVQSLHQGQSAAAAFLASFQEQGSARHSLLHQQSHIGQTHLQMLMTFASLVPPLAFQLSFFFAPLMHLFKRNTQTFTILHYMYIVVSVQYLELIT